LGSAKKYMKKVLKIVIGTFFLSAILLPPLLEGLKGLYCKVFLDVKYPLIYGCNIITGYEFLFALALVYALLGLVFLWAGLFGRNVKHVTPEEPDASKDLFISRAKNKSHFLSQDEIDDQVREADLRKSKLELKKRIFILLEGFNFKGADQLYIENKIFLQGYIDEENLDEYRSKLIREYFSKNFVKSGMMEHPPDFEQAEAIGAVGQNVLVSARAGSGKTATISAKVAYLCARYGIKPSEIMVLCFNKSAAKNMREKIQDLVPGFENARTFHSWASSIVVPEKGSLLFDDKEGKEGEFSSKAYSNFIKKLITRFGEERMGFKKEVYGFFREESEDLDESLSETKYFRNNNDRYSYLRNLTYLTLSGDKVKSKGEKWIADFLFEHDIEFYYEQKLSWNKISGKSYHPDFTIKTVRDSYVLEHWGINENDTRMIVPDHWTKTWREYKREMKDKRDFFRFNANYSFIETSITDIEYNLPYKEQRQNFEELLRDRLEENGISCKKLPEDVLVNNVWEKQLFSRMDQLMGQFIAWMQKLEWGEDDVREAISRGSSSKQVHFCNIGIELYQEYIKELQKLKKIDFNILMSLSVEKIRSGEYDVSDLKYILIDEFQDFSQLFQNLVDAIRERNPGCNLFCVGDSWQLINGFAGSELKYFEQYEHKADVKVISTCYRSDHEIIDAGNYFADKNRSVFSGKRSQYFSPEKGTVSIYNIDDVRIENDSKSRKVDGDFKKPFRKISKNGKEFLSYESAQYLKLCLNIVKENPGKTILFLSRNSKMNGINLDNEFRLYLLELLKEKNIPVTRKKNEEPLRFKTMHSSKGLDDDVVVLMNVCNDVIPSIHPSSKLFEVFGRTPNKILDEEKRLFYVAITRAKKKLYILTNDRPSEFISG